jgi:hypothetical protein
MSAAAGLAQNDSCYERISVHSLIQEQDDNQKLRVSTFSDLRVQIIIFIRPHSHQVDRARGEILNISAQHLAHYKERECISKQRGERK